MLGREVLHGDLDADDRLRVAATRTSTEVATAGRGSSSRSATASWSTPLTNQPAVVDMRRPAGQDTGWTTPSTGTSTLASCWSVPLAGARPDEWQRIAAAADAARDHARVGDHRGVERLDGTDTISLRRERARRADARQDVVLPELAGVGRRRALPGQPEPDGRRAHQNHVVLHYGYTGVDLLGWALTLLGLVGAGVAVAGRGLSQMPEPPRVLADGRHDRRRRRADDDPRDPTWWVDPDDPLAIRSHRRPVTRRMTVGPGQRPDFDSGRRDPRSGRRRAGRTDRPARPPSGDGPVAGRDPAEAARRSISRRRGGSCGPRGWPCWPRCGQPVPRPAGRRTCASASISAHACSAAGARELPALGGGARLQRGRSDRRDRAGLARTSSATPRPLAHRSDEVTIGGGARDRRGRRRLARRHRRARPAAAGADQVLALPVNRGKGAAVRAGMLAARGRTVAFTDADLSYSPDHLLELLEQVEAGWDVVVGSRRHDDTTTLVAGPAGARDRRPGHQPADPDRAARQVPRHAVRAEGLPLRRGPGDLRPLPHRRVRLRRRGVPPVEPYQLSLAEVPVRVVNSSRSTVHVVRDALRTIRDLFRVRRVGPPGPLRPRRPTRSPWSSRRCRIQLQWQPAPIRAAAGDHPRAAWPTGWRGSGSPPPARARRAPRTAPRRSSRPAATASAAEDQRRTRPRASGGQADVGGGQPIPVVDAGRRRCRRATVSTSDMAAAQPAPASPPSVASARVDRQAEGEEEDGGERVAQREHQLAAPGPATVVRGEHQAGQERADGVGQAEPRRDAGDQQRRSPRS